MLFYGIIVLIVGFIFYASTTQKTIDSQKGTIAEQLETIKGQLETEKELLAGKMREEKAMAQQQMEEDEYSSGESSGYVSPVASDDDEDGDAGDEGSVSEHGFSKSTLGPSPFSPTKASKPSMAPVPPQEPMENSYKAPAPSEDSPFSHPQQRRYSPGAGYDDEELPVKPTANVTSVDPYKKAQYISNDPENDPYYNPEQDPRNEQAQKSSVPVHHAVYPDAEPSHSDLERGNSSYKHGFEDSMVFSEARKRDRRTMIYLVGCLACALVALAALTGGIVGAIIYRENRGGDEPAAAPTVVVPTVSTGTTPSPVAAPVVTTAPVAAPKMSPNNNLESLDITS